MKRIVAALVLSAAVTTQAAAADDFLTRFLGVEPGPGKTFACFDRVYDGAHLKAHPQQNVRTMAMLAARDSEDPNDVDVRIGVTFRAHNKMFEADGNCAVWADQETGGSTVHCSVACDGGAIDLTLKPDGAALVAIPDGARMWDPNDAGAPDDTTVGRKFGPDDKLFRLDRARLAACVPLAADGAERTRLTRR